MEAKQHFDLSLHKNAHFFLNRAQAVSFVITEAFYSHKEKPNFHSHHQLMNKVAQLLVDNPNDTYPVQILYAYFVGIGSEKMESFLQELGHIIVNNYGVPFNQVEWLLNHTLRRLSAVGHMRSLQRQKGGHHSLIPRPHAINPSHMMQGQWAESDGGFNDNHDD